MAFRRHLQCSCRQNAIPRQLYEQSNTLRLLHLDKNKGSNYYPPNNYSYPWQIDIPFTCMHTNAAFDKA